MWNRELNVQRHKVQGTSASSKKGRINKLIPLFCPAAALTRLASQCLTVGTLGSRVSIKSRNRQLLLVAFAALSCQ